MSDIARAVEKQLKKSTVTADRFRQLISRLLGRGILCYGDTQTESELYNDAARVEGLLKDYFAVMGARLEHDSDLQYFRLYPPGADTSLANDDDDADASMCENLSQHETACVLVLRLLYDQALQAGNLDDEHEVQIPMEALHTALQTRLKRSLPERMTERKNLFRKLKRFKLIRYTGDDDLEKPESVLSIRPLIVGFVNHDALAALQTAGGSTKPATDS